MALGISRAFRDISLSIARHPVTNDILTIRNEDAIKKSVTNLVRTEVGERFFNFSLGSSVSQSLFELHNQELGILLEEEIKTLLTNYEPRIKVRNISVISDYDSNELNVEMEYDIIGQGFPRQKIEFILQSSRA
jgi:phage baseplate assembly protein W